MSEFKKCKYCDEKIRVNAVKCKHCGSDLTNSENIMIQADPISNVRLALSSKYEIVRAIGKGGMATVYEAIQTNLNRKIALKVVHNNLVHDQEFLQRFHREAQLSGSLNHQNIITIYDEGQVNNVHYMSMEYLEGQDLSQQIKKNGNMDINMSINIISAICSAIDYAHKKGLVHRDIKSSNIIITNEGRPVLTDFGIAHAASISKLTQTGTIIGTPEYMSPEQAQGLNVDARSDLYSLGVVFYECITGHPPFQGENPLSIIYKIINDPIPSPKIYNNNIPVWLDSVFNIALAKNPNLRYQSGEEFQGALKGIKIPKRKTKKNKNTLSDPPKARKYFNYKFFILSLIFFIAIAIVLLIVSQKSRTVQVSFADNNWERLSNSDKDEVTELIQKGDTYLSQNNLITPSSDNAYDYFKEVLRIHPTNNNARNKLKIIADSLFGRTNRILNGQGIDSAINFVIPLYTKFKSDIRFKDFINLNYVEKLNNEMISANQDKKSKTIFNLNNIIASDPDNKEAVDALVALESYNKTKTTKQVNGRPKLKDEEKKNIPKADVNLFVTIPNLVNFQAGNAENILKIYGLKLGDVKKVPSAVENKNLVINQIPKAGLKVQKGTAVIVIIGK